MGIIISGVLPLFLNTITAGKSASHYSNAYKIADSKIEAYRNTSFDSIVDENIDITDELPLGAINTDITDEDEDFKKVELTISWNFKRNQEIKIVTYIYRGGLWKRQALA